jgi:type I restriction enzyme M protein
VLFIDARDIYRQIDRAHRDWMPEQIEFLANIVRLWRGEVPESIFGSDQLLLENFPDKTYLDIPGLCAEADAQLIEAQGWSLNPGRYVGLGAALADDGEFVADMEALQEQFAVLTVEAATLAERIEASIDGVLRA